MCRNKKKSLGTKLGANQLDILVGEKGAVLSRCVRARIVMVNNDSSSLVRFSNFYEEFRQSQCGVPLRIDRPTLLKWNTSPTV